jgi:hypothetical protein
MLCFMMWMSGSTLHLFSIMTTLSGIYQPLSGGMAAHGGGAMPWCWAERVGQQRNHKPQLHAVAPRGCHVPMLFPPLNCVPSSRLAPSAAAILKSKDVFPADPQGELDTTTPRILFCLVHSLGVGFALWKIVGMGLLPTELADWVSSMRPPTQLEHAVASLLRRQ